MSRAHRQPRKPDKPDPVPPQQPEIQEPEPGPPPEGTTLTEFEDRGDPPPEAEPAEPPDDTPNAKPPLGRPPNARSFWDRLTDYGAEAWTGGQMIIYLYRLEPFIDRMAGGRKSVFVMKYFAAIDIDTIMQEHGSGRYKLLLNRALPTAVRGTLIDSCEFEILNPKFPPKVPPGEWVDDPRNKKWAWARPSDATASNQPQQTDPLAFAAQVMDYVERRTRSQTPAEPGTSNLDKILAVIANVGNPANMITALQGLKTLTGDEGKGTAALLQMLMDQNTEMREELRDIRNQRAEPKESKSLLEQLREAIDLTKTLKSMGGQTAAPGNDWADILPSIAKEAASGILPSIPLLIQAILNSHRPPTAQAYAPPPYPAQSPAATPAVNQAAPAVPADLTEYLKLLGEIQGPMVRYVNNGYSGKEFAEWFEDAYGAVLFGKVKALGADKLVTAFRVSPLWPQLAAIEAQFVKFCSEFCAATAAPLYEDDAEPMETGATEASGDSSGSETIDLS